MVRKTVGIDDKEEYCLVCERVTRVTFMDGGTDIPLPTSESKQMALEEMLNGIERIPHVKRR